MVVSNNSESELALACLSEIEELRDEYGRLSDEPRHPNIETGHPVPLEPPGRSRMKRDSRPG